MGASAGLIALGLGGAAGSLGAGVLSSSSASKNNNAALGFNKWSQLESQRYNKEMYEKQLQDQIDMYTKYQSPQAIAQQLRAAGINPAAATSQVAGGNMPSAPSAAGSSPLSAPALQNEGEGLGRGFEGMVHALGQMYSSNLQDAQAQETRSLLQGKIDSLLKQNNLTELQGAYQGMMNDLTSKYGDKKWSAEVQDLLSRSVLNYANGDLAQAQTDVAKVMKLINDEELGIKQEERANISLRIAKALALVDEQIATEKTKQQANKAGAAASYGVAELNKALAKTEDKLRDQKYEFASLQNDILTLDKFIKGNELAFSDKTLDSRVIGFFNQMEREGLINQKYVKELEILATQSDWAGRQAFANYVGTLVGAFSNALGSFASLRGVDLSRLSAKERNAIQDKFVDEYVRQSQQMNSAKRSAVLGPDWEMYSDQFFGR